jgi:hypothetical protein
MRVTDTIVLLFALSASELAFGQQEKQTWQEYTYPADSFAVTAPTAPNPHASPALPGGTSYMVQLSTDTGVVLRAKTVPDCSGVIPRRKESLLSGKDARVGHSSLKDLSLNGHAGLEYKWKTPANTVLERWYCIDGHLYILSASWPSSQPFPEAATRILDSFRFVTPQTQ